MHFAPSRSAPLFEEAAIALTGILNICTLEPWKLTISVNFDTPSRLPSYERERERERERESILPGKHQYCITNMPKPNPGSFLLHDKDIDSLNFILYVLVLLSSRFHECRIVQRQPNCTTTHSTARVCSPANRAFLYQAEQPFNLGLQL